MLKKIKNKYVKVILMENKTDLEEQRINNLEEAYSLAKKNNFILWKLFVFKIKML